VLAFLADRMIMGTLERDDSGSGSGPDSGRWRWVAARGEGQFYRLCRNYSEEHVCNWAIPEREASPYCRSCRLTRIIPNLSDARAREAWARLEAAKRRTLYTLLRLGLPVAEKSEKCPEGLAFEFLADPPPDAPNRKPVLTGHADGVITINIAEADDAERERRRHQMDEAYRTLLGHFRHETGHYYWDRLIRDSKSIGKYRELFGDERQPYSEALARYHAEGPRAGWEQSFVSAYSTAHPWEDWAETWAHYLHMIDTLETAVECGLSIRSKHGDLPAMKPDVAVIARHAPDFDQLIDRWFPLTYVLNSLNRGMGLPDAYPFVLSTPALEKLRFVHSVVD
jgi:hypothetical protein